MRRRRRQLHSALPGVEVGPSGQTGPWRGHGWGGAVNDYVCGGGDACAPVGAQTADEQSSAWSAAQVLRPHIATDKVWVDHPEVRSALHVPLNSYFYDSDGGGPYHGSEKNLMPFYQQVAKTTQLRVLIYNGCRKPPQPAALLRCTPHPSIHPAAQRPAADRPPPTTTRPCSDTDPSINSFEAANWTAHLGFTPTQPWRPWTLDACLRMGGYVTRYERERFDFLTIRGSGHMVPQFKPAQAFEFLRAWLKGEDWKRYNGSCTKPPE